MRTAIKHILALSLLTALFVPLNAATLPRSKPCDVGMSAERLLRCSDKAE